MPRLFGLRRNHELSNGQPRSGEVEVAHLARHEAGRSSFGPANRALPASTSMPPYVRPHRVPFPATIAVPGPGVLILSPR